MGHRFPPIYMIFIIYIAVSVNRSILLLRIYALPSSYQRFVMIFFLPRPRPKQTTTKIIISYNRIYFIILFVGKWCINKLRRRFLVAYIYGTVYDKKNIVCMPTLRAFRAGELPPATIVSRRRLITARASGCPDFTISAYHLCFDRCRRWQLLCPA